MKIREIRRENSILDETDMSTLKDIITSEDLITDVTIMPD